MPCALTDVDMPWACLGMWGPLWEIATAQPGVRGGGFAGRRQREAAGEGHRENPFINVFVHLFMHRARQILR